MSAEPAPEVMAAWTTVAQVLDWVPIADETLRTAWLEALGLQPGDPVRSLAEITEEDIMQVRGSLRIREAVLTAAAKGRVVASWRVARIAVGLDRNKAEKENIDTEKRAILLKQATAQAAAAQGPGTDEVKSKKPVEILGLNQVDLATTLDQSYTGTVPMLSDKELIDLE